MKKRTRYTGSKRHRKVRLVLQWARFLGICAIMTLIPLAIFYFSGEDRPQEPDVPAATTDGTIQTPDPDPAPGPAPEPDPEPTVPEGYSLREMGGEAIHTGDLILVNNKTNAVVPEDAALVNVAANKGEHYYIRGTDLALTAETLAAFNALMDGFAAQGGSKTINMVAAWRSLEQQEGIFARSAEQNGEEHANRYVARPGHSEHHTGLAIDLSFYFPDGTSADFVGEGEYAWITDHCVDYGLILRYAAEKEAITGIAEESWHFRYVGVPHAAEIVRLGYCLEEYMDYLRGFPFDGEHLMLTAGEDTYEIWFEEGTAVHVPDKGETAISGNNVDGFIITVKNPGK